MWATLKKDFNNPGQAVASGSALDWFLVFGIVLLIGAGWKLVLVHLKGATL
jgi:hypothetical protein